MQLRQYYFLFCRAWIGLKVEGNRLLWNNGKSEEITAWKEENLENHVGTSCVSLSTAGIWNLENCSTVLPSFCEVFKNVLANELNLTRATYHLYETNVIRQLNQTDTTYQSNERNAILQLNQTDTTYQLIETKTIHQMDQTNTTHQSNERNAILQLNQTDTTYQLIETKAIHQMDQTNTTHKLEETNAIPQLEQTSTLHQPYSATEASLTTTVYQCENVRNKILIEL